MNRAGLTLVEVVFAVAVLSVTALLLTASLASSQRMTALAREQEVATNAIRTWVEHMRQAYPTTKGSTDLSEFFADASTPADVAFLASGAIEGSILKGLEARVMMSRTEAPAALQAWDKCQLSAGASGTPRMNDSQVNATGVAGSDNAVDTDDIAALYGPTRTRDLNGDGDTTDGQVATSAVQVVPCKVELRWLSGAGGNTINATTRKQKLVVYVLFTAQH